MMRKVWIEDGQPGGVQRFIGRTVRRMWIMEKTVVMQLEKEDGRGFYFLMVEAMEPDEPGAAAALKIEPGDTESTSGTAGLFSELDRMYPPTYELVSLFRRKFTGIESVFLTFEGGKAIAVELDGIKFAKRRAVN